MDNMQIIGSILTLIAVIIFVRFFNQFNKHSTKTNSNNIYLWISKKIIIKERIILEEFKSLILLSFAVILLYGSVQKRHDKSYNY